MPVPRSIRRSGAKGGAKSPSKSKKGSSSCIRSLFEFVFFLAWLICTGIGGYFVGHTPIIQDCPPPVEQEVITKKADCVYENSAGSGVAIGATNPDGGYTFDELTRMWKCSHAVANMSQANQKILPKEKNLDKTKWKSILSVDPKSFFEKYLSQYPGDTRSVQPVVVFSHKPLKNFNEISDVCKVIDVAIVPDSPGVCVAVTETFHDVASYHMLHADRQADGTFALTSNSVEGRTLPSEKEYAAARALLLEYFEHVDSVSQSVKGCPKFGQGRVVVGTLVETAEEFELYKNSFASAQKKGVNKGKFCAFTTSSAVRDEIKSLGIHTILLTELADVGTKGDADVGSDLRHFFLQSWLAFAVANSNIKMMWAGAATIWLDRPDNIVTASPLVETLWAFTGRKDKRAAPFFVSSDFFVPTSHERPVHLMHEVLLHFDLVMAWKSLDAVISYRLSENNARYGTTTYVIPPFKVLHADLVGRDTKKIQEALISAEAPKAIVFPVRHQFDSPQGGGANGNFQENAGKIKALLQASGLWYI